MVMVYCEGPTEWHVIRKLNIYGILAGQLIEYNNRNIHIMNSPEKITKKLITSRPSFWRKFFLVYDREHYSSPEEFVKNKFSHLGMWHQCSRNIFYVQLSGRIVYLHVNDALSPNGYGDFDGYIWDLINRLGDNAVNLLFQHLPGYIRNINPPPSITAIHDIGFSYIPGIMRNNANFPIQRSKGYIYAYIAALQMAKSHVWFAEKLVEAALQQGYTNEVQEAFSSLIQAWNWLVGGTCP